MNDTPKSERLQQTALHNARDVLGGYLNDVDDDIVAEAWGVIEPHLDSLIDTGV